MPDFGHVQDLAQAINYTRGFCGHLVGFRAGWMGQQKGWESGQLNRWVYITICPSCENPTYHGWGQHPGVPFGDTVESLPEDVSALYEEARSATGAGNNAAAVLCGRKLLMHVAVERGAEPNSDSWTTAPARSARGRGPRDRGVEARWPDAVRWVPVDEDTGGVRLHRAAVA